MQRGLVDGREAFGALVVLAALKDLHLQRSGGDDGSGSPGRPPSSRGISPFRGGQQGGSQSGSYLPPGSSSSGDAVRASAAIAAVRRRARAQQLAPGSTVTLAGDNMKVPSLRQRCALLYDLFTKAPVTASAGVVTTEETRAAADAAAGLSTQGSPQAAHVPGDALMSDEEAEAAARVARREAAGNAREPGITYRKLVQLLGTVAVGLHKVSGTAVPTTSELYDTVDRAFGLTWQSPQDPKGEGGGSFDPSAAHGDAASAGARGDAGDRRASALMTISRGDFLEFCCSDLGILGFLSGLRSTVKEATQTALDLKSMFSDSALFKEAGQESTSRRRALLDADSAARQAQALWSPASALHGEDNSTKNSSSSLRQFRARKTARAVQAETEAAAKADAELTGQVSPAAVRVEGGSPGGMLAPQQLHSRKVVQQLQAHPFDRAGALKAAQGSTFEGDKTLMSTEARRPNGSRGAAANASGKNDAKRAVGVGGDLRDAFLEVRVGSIGSIAKDWYTHPMGRLTSRDTVHWALQQLEAAQVPDRNASGAGTGVRVFQEQAAHLAAVKLTSGLDDKSYRASFWGSGGGVSSPQASMRPTAKDIDPGTAAAVASIATQGPPVCSPSRRALSTREAAAATRGTLTVETDGGQMVPRPPSNGDVVAPLAVPELPLMDSHEVDLSLQAQPVEAPLGGHATPLHTLFFTWQAHLASSLQAAYLMAPHIAGGHLRKHAPLPPATPLWRLLQAPPKFHSGAPDAPIYPGGAIAPHHPPFFNESTPLTTLHTPLMESAGGGLLRGAQVVPALMAPSVFGPAPPGPADAPAAAGLASLRSPHAAALLALMHAMTAPAPTGRKGARDAWSAAAIAHSAVRFAGSLTAVLGSISGGGHASVDTPGAAAAFSAAGVLQLLLTHGHYAGDFLQSAASTDGTALTQGGKNTATRRLSFAADVSGSGSSAGSIGGEGGGKDGGGDESSMTAFQRLKAKRERAKAAASAPPKAGSYYPPAPPSSLIMQLRRALEAAGLVRRLPGMESSYTVAHMAEAEKRLVEIYHPPAPPKAEDHDVPEEFRDLDKQGRRGAVPGASGSGGNALARRVVAHDGTPFEMTWGAELERFDRASQARQPPCVLGPGGFRYALSADISAPLLSNEETVASRNLVHGRVKEGRGERKGGHSRSSSAVQTDTSHSRGGRATEEAVYRLSGGGTPRALSLHPRALAVFDPHGTYSLATLFSKRAAGGLFSNAAMSAATASVAQQVSGAGSPKSGASTDLEASSSSFTGGMEPPAFGSQPPPQHDTILEDVGLPFPGKPVKPGAAAPQGECMGLVDAHRLFRVLMGSFMATLVQHAVRRDAVVAAARERAARKAALRRLRVEREVRKRAEAAASKARKRRKRKGGRASVVGRASVLGGAGGMRGIRGSISAKDAPSTVFGVDTPPPERMVSTPQGYTVDEAGAVYDGSSDDMLAPDAGYLPLSAYTAAASSGGGRSTSKRGKRTGSSEAGDTPGPGATSGAINMLGAGDTPPKDSRQGNFNPASGEQGEGSIASLLKGGHGGSSTSISSQPEGKKPAASSSQALSLGGAGASSSALLVKLQGGGSSDSDDDNGVQGGYAPPASGAVRTVLPQPVIHPSDMLSRISDRLDLPIAFEADSTPKTDFTPPPLPSSATGGPSAQAAALRSTSGAPPAGGVLGGAVADLTGIAAPRKRVKGGLSSLRRLLTAVPLVTTSLTGVGMSTRTNSDREASDASGSRSSLGGERGASNTWDGTVSVHLGGTYFDTGLHSTFDTPPGGSLYYLIQDAKAALAREQAASATGTAPLPAGATAQYDPYAAQHGGLPAADAYSLLYDPLAPYLGSVQHKLWPELQVAAAIASCTTSLLAPWLTTAALHEADIAAAGGSGMQTRRAASLVTNSKTGAVPPAVLAVAEARPNVVAVAVPPHRGARYVFLDSSTWNRGGGGTLQVHPPALPSTADNSRSSRRLSSSTSQRKASLSSSPRPLSDGEGDTAEASLQSEGADVRAAFKAKVKAIMLASRIGTPPAGLSRGLPAVDVPRSDPACGPAPPGTAMGVLQEVYGPHVSPIMPPLAPSMGVGLLQGGSVKTMVPASLHTPTEAAQGVLRGVLRSALESIPPGASMPEAGDGGIGDTIALASAMLIEGGLDLPLHLHDPSWHAAAPVFQAPAIDTFGAQTGGVWSSSYAPLLSSVTETQLVALLQAAGQGWSSSPLGRVMRTGWSGVYMPPESLPAAQAYHLSAEISLQGVVGLMRQHADELAREAAERQAASARAAARREALRSGVVVPEHPTLGAESKAVASPPSSPRTQRLRGGGSPSSSVGGGDDTAPAVIVGGMQRNMATYMAALGVRETHDLHVSHVGKKLALDSALANGRAFVAATAAAAAHAGAALSLQRIIASTCAALDDTILGVSCGSVTFRLHKLALLQASALDAVEVQLLLQAAPFPLTVYPLFGSGQHPYSSTCVPMRLPLELAAVLPQVMGAAALPQAWSSGAAVAAAVDTTAEDSGTQGTPSTSSPRLRRGKSSSARNGGGLFAPVPWVGVVSSSQMVEAHAVVPPPHPLKASGYHPWTSPAHPHDPSSGIGGARPSAAPMHRPAAVTEGRHANTGTAAPIGALGFPYHAPLYVDQTLHALGHVLATQATHVPIVEDAARSPHALTAIADQLQFLRYVNEQPYAILLRAMDATVHEAALETLSQLVLPKHAIRGGVSDTNGGGSSSSPHTGGTSLPASKRRKRKPSRAGGSLRRASSRGSMHSDGSSSPRAEHGEPETPSTMAVGGVYAEQPLERPRESPLVDPCAEGSGAVVVRVSVHTPLLEAFMLLYERGAQAAAVLATPAQVLKEGAAALSRRAAQWGVHPDAVAAHWATDSTPPDSPSPLGRADSRVGFGRSAAGEDTDGGFTSAASEGGGSPRAGGGRSSFRSGSGGGGKAQDAEKKKNKKNKKNKKSKKGKGKASAGTGGGAGATVTAPAVLPPNWERYTPLSTLNKGGVLVGVLRVTHVTALLPWLPHHLAVPCSWTVGQFLGLTHAPPLPNPAEASARAANASSGLARMLHEMASSSNLAVGNPALGSALRHMVGQGGSLSAPEGPTHAGSTTEGSSSRPSRSGRRSKAAGRKPSHSSTAEDAAAQQDDQAPSSPQHGKEAEGSRGIAVDVEGVGPSPHDTPRTPALGALGRSKSGIRQVSSSQRRGSTKGGKEGAGGLTEAEETQALLNVLRGLPSMMPAIDDDAAPHQVPPPPQEPLCPPPDAIAVTRSCTVGQIIAQMVQHQVPEVFVVAEPPQELDPSPLEHPSSLAARASEMAGEAAAAAASLDSYGGSSPMAGRRGGASPKMCRERSTKGLEGGSKHEEGGDEMAFTPPEAAGVHLVQPSGCKGGEVLGIITMTDVIKYVLWVWTQRFVASNAHVEVTWPQGIAHHGSEGSSSGFEAMAAQEAMKDRAKLPVNIENGTAAALSSNVYRVLAAADATRQRRGIVRDHTVMQQLSSDVSGKNRTAAAMHAAEAQQTAAANSDLVKMLVHKNTAEAEHMQAAARRARAAGDAAGESGREGNLLARIMAGSEGSPDLLAQSAFHSSVDSMSAAAAGMRMAGRIKARRHSVGEGKQ